MKEIKAQVEAENQDLQEQNDYLGEEISKLN